MKLQDKVIIVTGGGSGIGRATSLKLAAEGATVVAADYNENSAKETAELVQKAGGKASFFRADVSKYDEVLKLVDYAVETHGTLNGIFNNAGVGGGGPVLDQDMDAYYRTININQHGVAFGIFAAGKKMKEIGASGAIVNTASIYGFMAAEGNFAYNASKAAVVMMTKTAALELTQHNIRVNAVAPGFIDTPILQIDDATKQYLANQQLHKKLIQPEKIADVVTFLFTEEAGAVNGQTLPVDDGFLIFK